MKTAKRTYSMTPEALALLDSIRLQTGASHSETLRRALAAYAKTLNLKAST